MELTDEQRRIVETAGDLADGEFADAACTWEGARPHENIATLIDADLWGLHFPERYGGRGLTEFESTLVLETVGRRCPDTAYAYTALFTAPRDILKFGTEAARERYLPPVVEDGAYVCHAISEPEAGSDIRSMTTAARERGDRLVVEGEKTWVGGFDDADVAVVWAKFPEGLGSLIVDLDDPGITVLERYTNMAGQIQTRFELDGVVVPERDVLVRGDDTLKDHLEALNWERLAGAVRSNAYSLFAFDRALAYAQDREQFGQPIAEFQGIEWKLADMAKKIEVSRALSHRGAQRAVALGRADRLDASVAKLYATEIVEEIVSEALQLHGARGYMRGNEMEYLYRLARGRRIGGGTTEVQKNSLAGVLKKRGELPSLLDYAVD